MSKQNNIFNLLLLLGILIIVTGCNSKKTIVKTNGTLVAKSKNELLSDVLNNGTKFRTISGKMDIELLPVNTKKSMKSGTYVKIIRDSVIQVSVRPILGAEVMKVTLTKDSLFVLDRYKKKYAAMGYDELKKEDKSIYFNYLNLQALLTDVLFVPGEKAVSENEFNRFSLDSTADMYLLKTKDKSGILYNFAVDAADRIASVLIFSPDRKYTLQWSYKDFIKDNNYIYPTEITANIAVDKLRFDMIISYSKININENITIDYSASKKYQKVTVGDILKDYLK